MLTFVKLVEKIGLQRILPCAWIKQTLLRVNLAYCYPLCTTITFSRCLRMSLCHTSFIALALISLSEESPNLLGSLIHSLVKSDIAHWNFEGSDT